MNLNLCHNSLATLVVTISHNKQPYRPFKAKLSEGNFYENFIQNFFIKYLCHNGPMGKLFFLENFFFENFFFRRARGLGLGVHLTENDKMRLLTVEINNYRF